jgi:putative heme-binding domain-containing protein
LRFTFHLTIMRRHLTLISTLTALASAALVSTAFAAPVWIWSAPTAQANEKADFWHEFTLTGPVKSAVMAVAVDNGAKVFLNGKEALEADEWARASKADVKKWLQPGLNKIKITATNDASDLAGLIATLTLTYEDGTKASVETSAAWTVSAPGSDAKKASSVIQPLGGGPWGDPFAQQKKSGSAGAATDPADIQVLPGFRVERLYTVPKSEQGSWVSMTTDPKGRLICGDQYGGLYRVTPGPVGSEEGTTTVEKLTTKIGGAHGLLYAFDALYVINNERANDACKPGLWRLRDTNGDEQFDTEEYLRELPGSGEHGPHSLVLSPDGKSLFLCCGNHTKPPTLEASRAARVWDEDHLLPRMWDANGHARGIMAPGGYVCKTDPEAKQFELISYGFRNEFDIAFNAEGDLFTYDADMEWDIGTPWYRPTRINHCVSGGDSGWRSGSGKWPSYYPDSLPAVIDIGPGSPTGVCFGTGAKFPEKYQRGLYAADWTYGTMYVLHLEEKGGTYTAKKEEFLSGKPLSLTDMVINPKDGAMYFAIGGRRNQSALYRVTHATPEPLFKRHVLAGDSDEKAASSLRRKMEALHTMGPDAAVVEAAWPLLGHEDRYVRFAARVAIERQPTASWVERLWAEKGRLAVMEGCIALARTAGKDGPRGQMLAKLNALEMGKFTPEQQLGVLRAYQLVCIRQGAPTGADREAVLARLEPLYPSKINEMDRELAQLLIFLESPSAVAQTVALMATATDRTAAADSVEEAVLARNSGYASAFSAAKESRPNRQQFYLAWWLRAAKTGWTPALRQQYFSWFPTTKAWKGGNSFPGFIENARKEALALVPEAERPALDALSTRAVVAATTSTLSPAKGPGKNYTIDDVLAFATKEALGHGRQFETGKNLFQAAACFTCHRFAGDGGGLGPDLSGVGSRYSMRDLLENIIDPSKVISDQYDSTQIEQNDGGMLVGRITKEEGGKLSVAINPLDPSLTVEIATANVKSRKPYPISMMPPGLLNALNEQEVLDLLAYLRSAGNPADPAFKK